MPGFSLVLDIVIEESDTQGNIGRTNLLGSFLEVSDYKKVKFPYKVWMYTCS